MWIVNSQIDQIANIHWIIEKAREFQKNIYFCFDYAKAFDCVDHNKLWKILKETGVPDHLTCILRNLHAGQEATVRTGHGTIDWFQIGKGVPQGCVLSPCLFNLHAEYIMRNAGLDEAQARIKFSGRNINNLRYAEDIFYCLLKKSSGVFDLMDTLDIHEHFSQLYVHFLSLLALVINILHPDCLTANLTAPVISSLSWTNSLTLAISLSPV